ncbi:ATP-binding cassette domain-containing protein [Oscillibacter sp.]|uniref:ATP-binding cassette domain-containing protein n=1 Tax=Oscillibacter sp. TaxID=1945593 RepID=UPI00289A46C6|nr:ATP-binding cassette domain-containing protein [Oscillibacter sp.]
MKNQFTRESIEITGASENNLKHISLHIPKEQLVVLSGVSGSGKSSLAFDTIAVESSRQWQGTYPLFLRNRFPRYERPAVENIRNLTPCVVVDQRAISANARSTVGTATDVAPLIRLLFSRVGRPSAGGSMTYSFNHPHGMCPECTGLGERVQIDETLMFDRDKSINGGAIRFSQFSGGSWQEFYYHCNPLLNPDKKLRDFSQEEWKVLRIGPDTPLVMDFIRNNTGQVSKLPYEGVVARFNRLYLNRDISDLKKQVRDEAMRFVHRCPCPACGGSGLNPLALKSKINGCNIADYYKMQVSDLLAVLDDIADPLGRSMADQIGVCLRHMVDVGLGYLNLNRRTDTLSGGEAQRLKIVRHLGSSLSNITYIFDEPTAGLHPGDANRIGKLLLDLRGKHNTVLVVEHNRQMIELADHIVELGPLAGGQGGEIVYQGDMDGMLRGDTPTAHSMREKLSVNPHPLNWTEGFPIQHARAHNLKDVSVTIPKGVLTAVTGVAGSGKSSLICHEFVARHPEAVVIDQKPMGISSRSTPATYTGVMDEIRKLFAKDNGVSVQWFSANSKGACPVCRGKGEITPDVAFADPVSILCEECQGRRFNPTALSYTYRGKNIEQVLNLTIDQALVFFPLPKIQTSLRSMQEVGLGYMTLGQPTSTLSGGEVQRLKLAGELRKEGNIYVLDEPATGLHHQDVVHLLALLRRLVAQGNTVVVVEHRMELIAAADWVIDMGPQGGRSGGRVLFAGVPEALLNCEASETAKFLRTRI